MAKLKYKSLTINIEIEVYEESEWLLSHINAGLERLFLIYNTRFKDISIRENWYHLFRILDNMNILSEYIECIIYEFLEEGDLTKDISHELIKFIQQKTNNEIESFVKGIII